MLNWTIVAIVVVVGVVGLVAAIGAMLPKGHHASRAVTLDAPPDHTFGVIADVARYPDWRDGVTRIELLPEDGRGLRFRETSRQGTIAFRVVDAQPPARFVVRIDDPSQPFGGTWTYALQPMGRGTELTITEDGEVYNPIFRFISRFFMSPTATMEAYQHALARRLSGPEVEALDRGAGGR